MMKKVLCIGLAFIFMFGMLQMVALGSGEVENLVPEGGNYEVTVYVPDDLPQDVQARIYAHFYGITFPDADQTRGLLCTLFGHKNTTSTVSSVTHNVYTGSYKCVQNTYITYTCSRCGNVETELISSVRINSCHG